MKQSACRTCGELARASTSREMERLEAQHMEKTGHRSYKGGKGWGDHTYSADANLIGSVAPQVIHVDPVAIVKTGLAKEVGILEARVEHLSNQVFTLSKYLVKYQHLEQFLKDFLAKMQEELSASQSPVVVVAEEPPVQVVEEPTPEPITAPPEPEPKPVRRLASKEQVALCKASLMEKLKEGILGVDLKEFGKTFGVSEGVLQDECRFLVKQGKVSTELVITGKGGAPSKRFKLVTVPESVEVKS